MVDESCFICMIYWCFVVHYFCFCNFQKIDPNIYAQLLEYDKRFEQYGSDFAFYDYNQPEDLPLELKHTYEVVVADPPYLVRHNFCQFLNLHIVTISIPFNSYYRVHSFWWCKLKRQAFYAVSFSFLHLVM